jgi:hypothetical protein
MCGLLFHTCGQSELSHFYAAYEEVQTSPEMARDNPHVASIKPAEFASQAKTNLRAAALFAGILFGVSIILFAVSLSAMRQFRRIEADDTQV